MVQDGEELKLVSPWQPFILSCTSYEVADGMCGQPQPGAEATRWDNGELATWAEADAAIERASDPIADLRQAVEKIRSSPGFVEPNRIKIYPQHSDPL